MKRLLPTIPFIFFLLLNACGGSAQGTIISADVGTAVAWTQTASMWTALPTHTPNVNISSAINLMNADLFANHPLEWTLDAEYYVGDMTFPPIPESTAQFFRVDVRCECAKNEGCCHPERTFVVLVESMKKRKDNVLPYVPGSVSHLLVVCLDFDTNAQLGAMTAPWQAVREYLLGFITGYQLGARSVRYTP